jgi:NAD(P)-dependent dehydrogenase (short-subunit alcohol dehydrogenase family)
VATGHSAIVTGANHGIGAATAQALAARGCAVWCTFLRVRDPADPGTPQVYRDHRAHDAAAVIARIRDGGGMAATVEADLSDPAAPATRRHAPARCGRSRTALVSLEIDGRFPPQADLDEARHAGLAAFAPSADAQAIKCKTARG